MNFEVFISCAVTDPGDTVGKHPSIPCATEQRLIVETVRAFAEKCEPVWQGK